MSGCLCAGKGSSIYKHGAGINEFLWSGHDLFGYPPDLSWGVSSYLHNQDSCFNIKELDLQDTMG